MPALGFPFLSPAPSRAVIAELFRTQRSRDPAGIRIHRAAACIAIFFVAWPTAYVEWALLPVLICFLVRLTGHVHVPGPLLWDRTARALLIWSGLVLASIAWTVGARHDWLNDIQSLRFALVIIAVYPALDSRRPLTVALLLGVACGLGSQLVHALAGPELPWLHWNRLPGRNSGWWDPVVGGSILCAALGMHLSGAALGRSRGERLIGLLGSGAVIAGLIATGTRGAWIGGALLLAVALSIGAWRVRPRSRLVRPAVAVAALLALGGAGAWFAAGPAIRARAELGYREARGALTNARYDTDTGRRIAMWRLAWMEFTTHPTLGVGAGGYRAYADSRVSRRGARAQPDDAPLPTPHAHAHSTYLHAAATTGVIGLTLLLTALGTAVWSGLRDPDGRGLLRGYDAGPALGLVGLSAAGLFDSVQVNQQTACLMYLLIALCLPSRPPEKGDEPRTAP